MNKLPELFTVKQAAEYLDITVAGIKYHLYKSGHLAGKTIGRDVLFTREELDTFKASGLKPRGMSGRKSK